LGPPCSSVCAIHGQSAPGRWTVRESEFEQIRILASLFVFCEVTGVQFGVPMRTVRDPCPASPRSVCFLNFELRTVYHPKPDSPSFSAESCPELFQLGVVSRFWPADSPA
jgi:hypothetical protein